MSERFAVKTMTNKQLCICSTYAFESLKRASLTQTQEFKSLSCKASNWRMRAVRGVEISFFRLDQGHPDGPLSQQFLSSTVRWITLPIGKRGVCPFRLSVLCGCKETYNLTSNYKDKYLNTAYIIRCNAFTQRDF